MLYTAMSFDCKAELLGVLVGNCKRIFDAQFGVNVAEPTLFQIVDLLRSDPDLKSAFLVLTSRTFQQIDGWGLEPHSPPRELIELVAHELRWPELRAQADQRIVARFAGDEKLARGDIATSIRDAYSDDWDDRTFYERYSGSP